MTDPILRSSQELAGTLEGYITTLESRDSFMHQVIDYCEKAYFTDRNALSQTTKDYLSDALKTIVNDINITATNLETFVSNQVLVVDSVTSQLDSVHLRLKLSREKYAHKNLNSFRQLHRYSAESTPVRPLSQSDVPQICSTLPEYAPIPLPNRLATLDDIGFCLSREEIKSTEGFSQLSSSQPSSRRAPATSSAPPPPLSSSFSGPPSLSPPPTLSSSVPPPPPSLSSSVPPPPPPLSSSVPPPPPPLSSSVPPPPPPLSSSVPPPPPPLSSSVPPPPPPLSSSGPRPPPPPPLLSQNKP